VFYLILTFYFKKTPEQLNTYDCGLWVTYFAFCLVHGHNVEGQLPKTWRKRVTCELLSKTILTSKIELSVPEFFSVVQNEHQYLESHEALGRFIFLIKENIIRKKYREVFCYIWNKTIDLRSTDSEKQATHRFTNSEFKAYLFPAEVFRDLQVNTSVFLTPALWKICEKRYHYECQLCGTFFKSASINQFVHTILDMTLSEEELSLTRENVGHWNTLFRRSLDRFTSRESHTQCSNCNSYPQVIWELGLSPMMFFNIMVPIEYSYNIVIDLPRVLDFKSERFEMKYSKKAVLYFSEQSKWETRFFNHQTEPEESMTGESVLGKSLFVLYCDLNSGYFKV
jgi:hypothetical protein